MIHPLRRFWRWFAVDEQSWVPRPRCPICDREVVGYRGATVRGDGWWTGLLPTEREVLIKHCPVHGSGHKRRRRRRRPR